MKKESLGKIIFDNRKDIAKISYESCKTLVQLFFATPYAIDKVESKSNKKLFPSIDDLVISAAFSSLLGGAILMATNSKPNMGGTNTTVDYVLAVSPLLINCAVNIYRMIESRVKPEEYEHGQNLST